ncbi:MULTISPECIES: IS21-like element helper ATPase IstB [Brevibacillus]|jgi:DNA replication protein DnaC|uniref:ATP-binding protein n=2 Tax=Brevibacillus TaxID=55080 RepID=V6M9X3_9BACL|nr:MULTISPECIES: IS21-like element helper ATPase IstB [Brevibacillus]EST55344.1 ATP-binding protein [Brevibacillus panacihumi W25]MBE5397689.1 ATP-binding protein [Brevibacillus borstelensis]MBG9568399.1 ATP-binding protein [Brevibacillus agri]MDH4619945.1 IS21-like element helper ATPase IstB [Brevibacillus sp. AY1]MED1875493.1 IS21-like element helper ATPase IstB [Brevibacillus borstelensis]
MREELAKVCKTLHLAHVMETYEQVPFEDRESFLLGVLRMEIQRREETKLKRLIKKAAFPQLKTLEDYAFEAVTLPETCTKEGLIDLRFLERKENVLMLGKVGTGKTHLATALGVEACRRGYAVRFFRVPDLVALLQEKHANGALMRFQKELADCELLILDEVGFVPFHQTGAELLFHVISACYERNSVIVTSNLEFGQWNTVFGDTRLTAALVDRLVHHAHILAFTGESYRLRHALSSMKSS